jgi:Uncharacterized conserved protein
MMTATVLTEEITRRKDKDYYLQKFNKLIYSEKLENTKVISRINGEEFTSVYKKIEEITEVPWIFTALIHCMESNFNFKFSLQDGCTSVVTIKDWVEDAIAVLKRKFDPIDFSDSNPSSLIYQILYNAEKWNGWGYAERGIDSPYLWSGSAFGEGLGKFVRDGVYDPNVRSEQIGFASMLHTGILAGIYDPYYGIIEYDPKGYAIRKEVLEFQKYYNTVTESTDRLKMDGWAGFKTSTACRDCFGVYLMGDDRNEGCSK